VRSICDRVVALLDGHQQGLPFTTLGVWRTDVPAVDIGVSPVSVVRSRDAVAPAPVSAAASSSPLPLSALPSSAVVEDVCALLFHAKREVARALDQAREQVRWVW
jgi:hypothetical protein